MNIKAIVSVAITVVIAALLLMVSHYRSDIASLNTLIDKHLANIAQLEYINAEHVKASAAHKAQLANVEASYQKQLNARADVDKLLQTVASSSSQSGSRASTASASCDSPTATPAVHSSAKGINNEKTIISDSVSSLAVNNINNYWSLYAHTDSDSKTSDHVPSTTSSTTANAR